MKRVHVLEGKQGAFKPTSNISYFTPKVEITEYVPETYVESLERQEDNRRWHNNDIQRRLDYNKNSWLQKGFIKVVGKTKSGTFVYDITDEGRALADSYVR
jgi:hypothetical protein